MERKLYLKKWLEKTLILINAFILIFFTMLEDFNDNGLIILFIMLVVFSFNSLVISKHGRLLKDNGEE